MVDDQLDAGEAECGDGNEQHAPIVFSLQQDELDKQQSALHEEREKHRRRAERFGSSYKDPGRVRKEFGLMMEARKERLQASHGFTTGNLDMFSQEERDKRTARAARFQLEAPLASALDSYRPDEELEARARRAAKFGVPYQPTDAVLMDMDLYEKRREVGTDVERRPEAIYLYGVDVMSTREVLSFFTEYGPVFVEWLDDSSCNVVFGDANSVKRAMVGKGTPLPPEVVMQRTAAPAEQPPPQDHPVDQSQEDPASGAAAAGAEATAAASFVRYQPELPVPDNLADVANLPYVWHKGRDIVKDGTTVSLVYRMATALDVRDMKQPKRTRELWKAGGGGGGGGGGAGRGGRGRGGGGGGQQQRRDKQPFRRGRGDGDGAADMEVDDDGPGADMEEEDGGDVPMKRQRGARGGQRLALKEVRPALQPYGGTSLLQGTGASVLAATGHVLDYTELEDEDPAAAGAGAEAAAERGGRRGRGGGRRDRGRRGGGAAGAVDEGDLRDVLKARRRAAAPRQQEGDGGDGGGGGGGGGDGPARGGEEQPATMDE